MTRYQFLKLLRRLIVLHLPSCHDWMPRNVGGYNELYVELEDGSYFRIAIEKID